jgi:SAM-dependent methyltransferase
MVAAGHSNAKLSPEYDQLAAFYDMWSLADPAAEPSRQFYVETCASEPGTVVELGVGTGRIAIDIAQRGKEIIGIDISSAMLARCRVKFEEAGLSSYLRLIESDVRTFSMSEPAALITFPFRSIGHLLTRQDKLDLFTHVRENLIPGGHFLFDHYVLDENWARNRHGIPQMMCRIDDIDGTCRLVWDVYLFDFNTQRMQCYIMVEELDRAGSVSARTYYPLAFSWLKPEQTHELLLEAGFEIEATYGDFSRTPFVSNSEQQIWLAKRSKS